MRIRAPASCKQGMSGGLCRGRKRGPPAVKGRVPGNGRQAAKDRLASQVHRSRLDHDANSEQVAVAGKEGEGVSEV